MGGAGSKQEEVRVRKHNDLADIKNGEVKFYKNFNKAEDSDYDDEVDSFYETEMKDPDQNDIDKEDDEG